MTCPNCFQELDPLSRFCGSCGAIVDAQTASQAGGDFVLTDEAEASASASSEKKPFPVKLVLLCAGVVAVLAVVLLVIFLWPSGSKTADPNLLFYLKDDAIYYTDLSKDAPYVLADDPFANSSSDEYYGPVVISSNGKKVMYTEEFSYNPYYEGVTLAIRSLNDPDSEPVKVDSGITSYAVNDDLTEILYLKNGNLYRSDLEEEERLYKNVSSFYATKDLSCIYFETYDDILYVIKGDEKAEKIDDEISRFTVADDFDAVYYITNDNKLYEKVYGEEEELIAKKVKDLYGGVDGTGIYYELLDDEEELEAIDYIRADSDRYSDWEDVLEDVYFGTLDTLYYYDGEETITLTETATSIELYSSTFIFQNCDPENLGKIKLSEIIDYAEEEDLTFYDAAETLLKQMLQENSTGCVAINGTCSDLGMGGIIFDLSKDGKKLHFLSNYDSDTSSGDLYEVSISDKKVGEPKLIDTEVYRYMFNEDGSAICIKDANSKKRCGDLYMDQECIAEDVVLNSYRVSGNDLYFFTDLDTQTLLGTLNYYDGDEVLEIGQDVYISGIKVMPDGELMYLQDYDTDDNKGNLCLYIDGESERYDRKVQGFVNFVVGACNYTY